MTDSWPIHWKHSRLLLAVIICGCLGVVARFGASSGELWLDEIWSLDLVKRAHNVLDIFTIRHDNNHILNSLWLWMCGAHAPVWLLRLPSVLFSSSVVIFLSYLTVRYKSYWIFWFFFLCVFSYPLIVFDSEARGYSLAVTCAVIASYALDLLIRCPTRRAAWIFAVSSTLGILSHAIFALYLAPILGWLYWTARLRRTNRLSRALLGRNLFRTAFILPGATLFLLSLFFYGQLEIGGGPVLPYLQVFLSTISTAFGGEELSLYRVEISAWCSIASAAILLIALHELWSWHRSGDRRASLCAIIVLCPLLAVFVLQPPFIYSRYFIIQIVAIYLLIGRFLARLTVQGVVGKLLVTAVGILYVFLNARHTSELILDGRAHAISSFNEMIHGVPGDEPITISSNQTFRQEVRLRYARLVLSGADRLHHVSEADRAIYPPIFIIREESDRYTPAPSTILDNGSGYTRMRSFYAPLLSGITWHVYALTERAEPMPELLKEVLLPVEPGESYQCY